MTIGDQPTTIRMVLHISELMISVDSDDQFSQCLGFFPGQKVKDSLQVIGEGFFDLAKKFALVRIPQVWTEFDGPPFDLFNERLGEFRRSRPGYAEAGQEKNAPTSTVVFMGFGRILGMKGNREGAGKHHLIIDFNENRVISGFFEFQSLDVVDEVDSMLRSRGFEFPVDDVPRFLLGHGNSN